jgi:hypothetical protein
LGVFETCDDIDAGCRIVGKTMSAEAIVVDRIETLGPTHHDVWNRKKNQEFSSLLWTYLISTEDGFIDDRRFLRLVSVLAGKPSNIGSGEIEMPEIMCAVSIVLHFLGGAVLLGALSELFSDLNLDREYADQLHLLHPNATDPVDDDLIAEGLLGYADMKESPGGGPSSPDMLALSGKDWLGLFPPRTQKGDLVGVLKGCRCPVVLRKVDKHYVHVGPCFVPGLMEGEAASLVKSGLCAAERIEIW